MIQVPPKISRLRGGFTLIELLVVLTIIAALTALTAGAVFRYLNTQQQNNTETTIAKIDAALKRQWQSVIDAANKEAVPAWVATNFGCNDDCARVIWIKLRLQQHFPMNFTEASTNIWAAADTQGQLNPLYLSELSQEGAVANWPPQNYESSACLLLALKRARGSASALNPDDAGSTSVSSTSTGIRYFVDAWNQPLAFYRWPTDPGNTEIDSLNKASTGSALIHRDSQDQDGKLMDPRSFWQATNNGVVLFVNNIHALKANPPLPQAPLTLAMLPNPLPAASSVNLVPVIVSGGPNKKLGFAVPAVSSTPDGMQINDANAANDNIYNFRLTLGARGDG